MRRYIHIMIGFLAICVLDVRYSHADSPGWKIQDFLNSRILTIRVYRIPSSQFGSFIDTAVSAGPFTSQLGGFVNEKILESISTTSNGEMDVIIISRFFDEGTAELVSKQRGPLLREIAGSDPIAISAELIENNFGNWNWEGGERSGAFQLASAKPYDTKRIMADESLTTSFGKSGYVGQTGMLESFPGDTNIESIRRELNSRSEIAGASIFKSASGYVVYSEYFRASEGLAGKKLSVSNRGETNGGTWFTGGQLGVVASNYGNR